MSIKRSFRALALGAMLATPVFAWTNSSWADLHPAGDGLFSGASSPATGATSDPNSQQTPSLSSQAVAASVQAASGEAGVNNDLQSLAGEKTTESTDTSSAMYQPTAMSDGPQVTMSAQYLDDVAEKPNIHGFAEAPFRSAYITPRGLVVENQGLVFQPVGGIVLPIGDVGPFKNLALITGVWNSINTNQTNHIVGGWNEMDFFFTMSANVLPELNLALTYGAWQSPPGGFPTEHNLDLKASYDDTKMWGSSGFGLHPYVDFWWAISGGSTVVLGRPGGTGYVEPGIVPTYTLKVINDYPITLTFPTYVQLGPSEYWSYGAAKQFGSGNIGLFSTAIQASMPLSFIPARYGYWHVDAGLTYDNLINKTLVQAGKLLSGNTANSVFNAEVGFGINF
ncbi:MAG: hypothetical protein M3O30_04815 [Planctomycetota bacterium]|nr:hypothetical protein [Planctomycetota bacterium]